MSRSPRTRKAPPAEVPDLKQFFACYRFPITTEELVKKWAEFGITAAVLDEALSAYSQPAELGLQNISVRQQIHAEKQLLTKLLKKLRSEWNLLDQEVRSIGRQSVASEARQPESVEVLLQAVDSLVNCPQASRHTEAGRASMDRLRFIVDALRTFWSEAPEDHKHSITWTAKYMKAPGRGWFSSLELFILLLEEHHTSIYLLPGNRRSGRWSEGRQKGEPTVIDIDAIQQSGSILRKRFTRAWSGQTAQNKLPTKAELLLYDAIHLIDSRVGFANIRSALKPRKSG